MPALRRLASQHAHVDAHRVDIAGTHESCVQVRRRHGDGPDHVSHRNHPAPLAQEAPPRVERDRDLIVGEHTSNIHHDHVSPLGERDPGREVFDEFDARGTPVGGHHVTRHLHDAACFDGEDASSTGPARFDSEHTGPSTDVEHDVTWLDHASNGREIRSGAQPVTDHQAVLDDVVVGKHSGRDQLT